MLKYNVIQLLKYHKSALYKIDTFYDITTDERIPFRTMTNTLTHILIALLCLQAAATQPYYRNNYSQLREYNRYYEHYYNMGEYMCPAITSDVYKPKPFTAVCTPTPRLPPLNVSQDIRDHGNRRHPEYIIAIAAANAFVQTIRILFIFAIKCIQYVSVIFSTTILLGIVTFPFIALLAYIISIY